MRCPACRLPLVTAEIEGLELDYCAEEFGVWLDAGELELLFGAAGPLVDLGQAGEPGKRRCPRCDRPMRRVTPAPGLELDACPQGDGLWFDAGELEALARAFAAEAKLGGARMTQVFTLLQRMIGGKR